LVASIFKGLNELPSALADGLYELPSALADGLQAGRKGRL
jgi:hypothetical protein